MVLASLCSPEQEEVMTTLVAQPDEANDHEWSRGYRFGFDDNYIEPWRHCYYSNAFIRGYEAGKAEINRLIDEAVEARNCDGIHR
jgi:hypothetical protein